MRLTWHIVQKDLRRMWVPLALWLGFVVVAAVWFRATSLAEHAATGGRAGYAALPILRSFVGLLIGIQMVVGYVLAGCVVLEDGVPGSSAHWLTRPIGRGRLLRAKAIGTTLMFVVAPALVLTPVWWANGFSAAQVLSAAGEFMVYQAAVTLLAVTIASLTENVGQFFFCSAAAMAAFFVCGTHVVWARWIEPVAGNMRWSRKLLLETLAPLVLMAILVHQFLTRRTRRGWIAMAGALGLTLAIRLAWPWDIWTGYAAWRNRGVTEERSEDRVAAVTLERMSLRADDRGALPLTVRVSGTPASGGFFAPRAGNGELSWPDGKRGSVHFLGGNRFGGAAALRLVGAATGEGALPWEMTARWWPVRGAVLRSGPAQYDGKFVLTRMHGRVLGELPLKAGAEFRVGPATTRLIALERNEGRVTAVIEQRDAWLAFEEGFALDVLGGSDWRKQECYVIVNRATGLAQVLPLDTLNLTIMSSLSVGIRRLEFTPPGRVVNDRWQEAPDWERGTVIVRVRFERDHFFIRELRGERLEIAEEKQP